MESARASSTFTVLTLNVAKEKEQLEARMTALAALVELHRPDLLMLQELSSSNRFTGPGHWSYLRELLKRDYVLPDDALLSEQGPGFKVALLARRPLVLEDLCVISSGALKHRPAMVGTCTWPSGETLGVASCHLSPDLNVGERTGQIRELQAVLGGHGSALIAGDTNMSESGADAQAAVDPEAGFVDCWRSGAFPGDERTRPRPGCGPEVGEYERIDRMFVRGCWRATQMEVVGAEPVSGAREGAVPKWWSAERRTISDHVALLGRFATDWRRQNGKAGAEDGVKACSEVGMQSELSPEADDGNE